MLSNTQHKKWRHTDDDAKWKPSAGRPPVQWNCKRVDKIEYAIEDTTLTMKTL